MVKLKPCGLKRQKARSYSPSSKDGYAQGSKDPRGSLLANSNLPLQRYGMHLQALWHAFTSILPGRGVLSPCNRLLKQHLAYMYLQQNPPVLAVLEGCRTLLRESTHVPTQCRDLVLGWPDYIGIVDASGHGVGGVIVGELSACTLIVF